MSATLGARGESCASPDDQYDPDGQSQPPALPAGRWIRSGERMVFYREVSGPPNAPTLLLLHGWLSSSGTNWLRSFGPLAERFRVIAPDQRGHGRGIRKWRRFRLEDCADDAAALLDALGIESAIPVGYSMGGPVAKLLWRRHPSRVRGLVLCATAERMIRGNRFGRSAYASAFSAMAGTTRLGQIATPLSSYLGRPLIELVDGAGSSSARIGAAADLGRHDLRMLMEAGAALGRYTAEEWLRGIDVPTAVVVTTKDRAILPEDQVQLALRIPGATLFCVDLGHTACTDALFTRVLVRACENVALRAATAPDPRVRARTRESITRTLDALLG